MGTLKLQLPYLQTGFHPYLGFLPSCYKGSGTSSSYTRAIPSNCPLNPFFPYSHVNNLISWSNLSQ